MLHYEGSTLFLPIIVNLTSPPRMHAVGVVKPLNAFKTISNLILIELNCVLDIVQSTHHRLILIRKNLTSV